MQRDTQICAYSLKIEDASRLVRFFNRFIQIGIEILCQI